MVKTDEAGTVGRHLSAVEVYQQISAEDSGDNEPSQQASVQITDKVADKNLNETKPKKRGRAAKIKVDQVDEVELEVQPPVEKRSKRGQVAKKNGFKKVEAEAKDSSPKHNDGTVPESLNLKVGKNSKAKASKDKKTILAPSSQSKEEETKLDVIAESAVVEEWNENSVEPKKEKLPLKSALKKPAIVKSVNNAEKCDTTPFKSLMNDFFLSSEMSPSDLGQIYFDWLISPMNREHFMKKYWETEYLYLDRKKIGSAVFDGLFSTKEFEQIIDQNDLTYGVNIDVTKYEDDQRVTLNPDGRVYSSVIWEYYNNGASVRFLNPQTYSKHVWRLNSILQQFFGTFVGANVYLTPPDSQGFAPHYDDIEAFVLQLEGRKKWSIYRSNPDGVLPRFSSPNFTRGQLGPLLFTVDLAPGDLLYMPRGCVHEATCIPGQHSLHITLSACQLSTYTDLIDLMLPQALKTASEQDVEFRRSLPLDYSTFMSTAWEDSDQHQDKRKYFRSHVRTLMSKLRDYLPIDASCDMMAKKFVHESQPLCIMPNDYPANTRIESASILRWNESKGRPEKLETPLGQQTKIRIFDQYCLRIIIEEGEADAVVYYNVNNSRVYKGKEPQRFDVTAEECLAIEFLIKSYPKFVPVCNLPLDSDVDKKSLANCLFELGLVITKMPLEKTKAK